MKKAISLILVLVMLVTSVSLIACNKETGDEESPTNVSDNFIVSKQEEEGIALLSESIKEEYFSKYGVSPTAEAAYTVTAVVLPADANQNVSWNLAWKNPSSSWANGKDVEDYVDIVLSDDTGICLISLKLMLSYITST